jgi:gamma-glutamyltranspeptidase/glutathione hydrolase
MPLPSSGGIVISQILTMLKQFNIKDMKHNLATYIHILSEIEKRCYADRNTYLGDPDYFPIKVDKLLDKKYLQKRAKSINPNIATKSKNIFPGYGEVKNSGLMLKESTETTSFAVLDKQGNCVSITYTLNGNYGCKVLLPETGILLNNEMDDFSSKPGTPNLFGLIGGIANKIEPEKRMLSSMTPAIVLNSGDFKMALGSPGGSTIITTVLQTYLNLSLFNMNIKKAINSPRFHHQWMPDNIYLEPELFNNNNLRQSLVKKGQNVKKREKIGNAIIILKQGNTVFAAADKRGTGVAIISR